jgi:hypoxanthine phosphoribosyltransferase
MLLKMSSENTELVTLISADEIREKIFALAEDIDRDYNGKTFVIIAILKGSFIFLADLVRRLKTDCIIEFMKVASYDDDPHESGNVKLLMDIGRNISGEHVVIVEDIVDSGKTLNYIYHNLLMRNPASLEIVTLLDKRERREIDLNIKYVGFDIPDHFVYGYGLDDAERFRNLPYIAYSVKKG